MDTRDLSVLMFSLCMGLPFVLGFVLGWKSARRINFSFSIRWPWSNNR